MKPVVPLVPAICLMLAICLSATAQAPPATSAQTQPAPSPEDQDRLLDRMHEYADHYINGLPNFLCTQVTRHTEALAGSEKWQKGDTLVERLSYNAGQEHRTVESVNGKRIAPGKKLPHSTPTQLSTEGEFGLLLRSVLGKDGRATFQWGRWDTVSGHNLAVFDYTVDLAHSDLELSSHENGVAKAIVPYHGSVWADPETGAVWRISDTTTEIPQRLFTRELSTVVDYSETVIGQTKYLLPVHATVLLTLWTRRVRHELDFQDYRKFEARSVITFGSDVEPDKKQ